MVNEAQNDSLIQISRKSRWGNWLFRSTALTIITGGIYAMTLTMQTDEGKYMQQSILKSLAPYNDSPEVKSVEANSIKHMEYAIQYYRLDNKFPDNSENIPNEIREKKAQLEKLCRETDQAILAYRDDIKVNAYENWCISADHNIDRAIKIARPASGYLALAGLLAIGVCSVGCKRSNPLEE